MKVEFNISFVSLFIQTFNPLIFYWSCIFVGTISPPTLTHFISPVFKYFPNVIGPIKREQNTFLCLTGASKKYFCHISTISLIHFIYKAILTTLTNFFASMPRIPRNCFFISIFCILLSHFQITIF